MSTSQLPEDLLVEVFLRLPVQSLIKFRCLSKSWKTLIDSKNFINLHLSHTKSSATENPKIIFLGNPKSRKRGGDIFKFGESQAEAGLIEFPDPFSKLYTVDLDSPGEMVTTEVDVRSPYNNTFINQIHGGCNGLLCLTCKNLEYHVLLLWNPSIGKYREVPIPGVSHPAGKNSETDFRWYKYGFGYDDSTDDYKVVRVVEFFYNSTQEVKVYSLKSNSWRSLSRFPAHFIVQRWSTENNLVNHALHWVMVEVQNSAHSSSTSKGDVIMALDLRTERYHLVPPPPEVLEGESLWDLGVLDDNLCVISRHNNYKSFYLGIMKVYGVEDSWTKVVLQPLPLNPFPILIAYSHRRSTEIFFHDSEKVYCYDTETGLVQKGSFFPSLIRSSGYLLIGSLVKPW